MEKSDTKIIINADDFGYNHQVNTAILCCFDKNIINSATLMVNFDGFQEAVQMAIENELKDRIGVHINLTEGRPLTDFSGTGLIDEAGHFNAKIISSPFIATFPQVRKKIKAEIYEQYEKLIKAGITPSHIDSHQHVHTLPLLAPIFINLAKEKGHRLRMPWTAKRRNFIKKGYIQLLSRYLKKRKINFSDIFCNINYFSNILKEKNDIQEFYEIMVHPTFEDSDLIDAFEFSDLEDKVKNLGIKL